LAASLSGAIHDAAGHLLQAFLDVVADDDRSPLRGRKPGDVTVKDGRIHLLRLRIVLCAMVTIAGAIGAEWLFVHFTGALLRPAPPAAATGRPGPAHHQL
jgi:hypothetical protein